MKVHTSIFDDLNSARAWHKQMMAKVGHQDRRKIKKKSKKGEKKKDEEEKKVEGKGNKNGKDKGTGKAKGKKQRAKRKSRTVKQAQRKTPQNNIKKTREQQVGEKVGEQKVGEEVGECDGSKVVLYIAIRSHERPKQALKTFDLFARLTGKEVKIFVSEDQVLQL